MGGIGLGNIMGAMFYATNHGKLFGDKRAINKPHRAKKHKKLQKNWNNLLFDKNMFFHNFKWYLGGLGVSGGMAWTTRCDSLELWQGLFLHGMGEVDFMFFGNIGNSIHHQIPPNWSSGLQVGPRIVFGTLSTKRNQLIFQN